MKTKILAVLVLISLGFTACAAPKKAKKQKTKHSTTTKATARGRLSMLTMSRTACFGRCPIYDVVVYSNGMVEYRGKRFTEYTGVYQKNIGKAATDLLAKFADKRIDTCKEKYELMVADVPGIWYRYTMNGRNGVVGNAEAGPMWLRTMSAEVDEIAKVDGSWKKISDTVPQ